MVPKYNMTVEQNIFVAKRNIVDYIWKSAKLEGLGVTYPDTEAIYNGITVAGLALNDALAINNLKHAWQFVLGIIDYDIDLNYICQINKEVGNGHLVYNAGYLRNIPVSIGGTTWKPDMPIQSQIMEELDDIKSIEEPTERAITLMLYLMRKQLFNDGNKRTAMLAGNQVMISNGCGIISVPIEKQHEFTKLLVEFYETNNYEKIKEFVYNECVDGMDFSLEMTQNSNCDEEEIQEDQGMNLNM